MQRGHKGSAPFQRLGSRLKQIRHEAKESLAEASGAVEIDSDSLERYERGESRPAEDILLLLMTHYDLTDDDADTLWHLAGYDKKKSEPHEETTSQQAITILPLDARVVYTDMVNVTANQFGVVMNFLQQGPGPNAGPVAVSRVGMSIDHARSVIEVLNHAISQATAEQAKQPPIQKQLPAPEHRDQSESS
jgi:transcriptional regulator with XRE-family HTH domain